ncbi:MAG: GAF domain-containing protein, partial [Anaerolineae bacterium]|nr:GAF domain-containing protein [Anaerolineae bacterium]
MSTEIDERKRVENALQEMMNSLESHVVARTEELSTFFDLILMAGQGVDLTEIFEYVVPRVMEFTKSQSVVVDLVEIGSDAMNMIAAGGLPEEAPARIYISQFPPELKHWMQSPNEPLLVADLAKEIPSFTQAFNLHDFPYQTLLSVQIRVGDRIDGILSCFRTEKGGYGVDEVAMATAVAQQLGMILETDHLRQQAQDLAVLEERERLARDLHDSVTQSLYSLSLFSRAGREAVEDGDSQRLTHVFTELEQNTLLILRELRLMLYDLRPPELGERSLAQAIEYRLNAVERRAGLQFDVAIDDPVGLSPADEGDLFYVVLEGLNNVVKHAQARHASLKLTQND